MPKKEWTPPETCPACGEALTETRPMYGVYRCGTHQVSYRDYPHFSTGCLHNQLFDYRLALRMVCDPDEIEQRLAKARAARLGGAR